MGDIGADPREIEFEPIAEPGVPEPIQIPSTPTPEREPVPA